MKNEENALSLHDNDELIVPFPYILTLISLCYLGLLCFWMLFSSRKPSYKKNPILVYRSSLGMQGKRRQVWTRQVEQWKGLS
jgi:hypothetical protein